MNAATPDFIARFYGRTSLNPETGCFEWQGAVSPNGYGKAKFGPKPIDTHRVAWMLTHGDIAPGMMICHTCDNRRCVNPRHLFLGTRSDNMVDAALKGRLDPRKARAGLAPKLTDTDVREIFSRVNAGEDRTVLAAQFGVSPTTISKIRHKRVARYEQIVDDLEMGVAS